jgi:hypothetical protein
LPRFSLQEKNIKHTGNITMDDIIEVARVMRPRSCAKTLAGTCKEMLGTAQSVGCTIDHQHPQAVMAKVRPGWGSVFRHFVARHTIMGGAISSWGCIGVVRSCAVDGSEISGMGAVIWMNSDTNSALTAHGTDWREAVNGCCRFRDAADELRRWAVAGAVRGSEHCSHCSHD